MNVRRSMTVGAVAALIMGGCAAHPNSTPPHGSDPAAPPATSADRAKWEARGDGGTVDGRPTPQQLAARAAKYAKTMESGGTAAADPPPVAAAARSSPSSVQFDAPAHLAPAPTDPASPAAAGRPAMVVNSGALTPGPATPVDPHAALLARSVQGNPMADMPVSIPEGAEFTSALRATDPLGTRLAKRAKANPQDPAAQLDYQLYLLLSGGTESAEPQLMSTVGLPPDERDVISAIVDGVSNFRSTVSADPNLTPTQQIRPMQDMVDRLRSGADLTLGTLAICRRVSGFGLYEPMAPARFPVGRGGPFFLYCEVDNFLPRHMPDGQWETLLAQQVSLYRADGTLVWADKAQGVTNACRARRRDFFTREPITLPPDLTAGAYKLRVTVRDRNANKVAESDVPLWVGGN